MYNATVPRAEGRGQLIRRLCLSLTVAALVLCSVALHAQQREWWPGTTYDPKIPTPKDVLGYNAGDYWTEHSDMTAYMRRLEARPIASKS